MSRPGKCGVRRRVERVPSTSNVNAHGEALHTRKRPIKTAKKSATGRPRVARRAKASTRLLSKAKSSTDAAGAPRKPSPFLELPAELRNEIYDYVAPSYTAVLRQNARGRLLTNSPLAAVSRQVCEEYIATLYLCAPITAHVKNLDFSHLVTFLNKLSDRELRALPSVNVPSERHILIKLNITDACPPISDMLNRWLLRCEHPTKKGTNLQVSYVVSGNQYFTPHPSYASISNTWHLPTALYRHGALGRPPHIGTPVGNVYHAQKRTLEKMEEAEMAEGRVYEELRKVVRALKKPGSVCSGGKDEDSD